MAAPIPFDLWAAVPASLATVIPNVMWSRDRLHGLVLPTVNIAVRALRWQLALPWWRVDDRPFAVSPDDVRRSPATYARQWQRTLDADLGFPIHVLARERLIILDGLHRLLKADLHGHAEIGAHIVSDALFMARIVEHG